MNIDYACHKKLLFCLILGISIIFPSENFTARTKKHPKKKVTAQSKTHSARLSRQAELAKLKKEIAETERQLLEHQKMERRGVRSLAAFNKRTKELKARLAEFRKEADDLQSQVEELSASIEQTSSSIDTVKAAYAGAVIRRYVSGTYHSQSAYSENSIFGNSTDRSPESRNLYLGHLVSSALHRNKIELDSTRTSLAENKEEVSQTLSEEMNRIDITRQQQLTAEEQKRAQEEKLRDIKSSKDRLQKELDRRKASAKKLEGIIANLLAKEEADRKAKEKELKRRMAERKKKRASGKKLTKKEEQEEAHDKIEAKNLAGPHSLSWPTSSHTILQGFGEHRNRELGTVTMNLGIDIGTSSGSLVRAASDGVVSLISSLPSYGTIVIIRHGGGVHTVYADLSSVSVSSGSKVSKGDAIAKSGMNSESGALLHFEVWKGKSKQNPLRWLK